MSKPPPAACHQGLMTIRRILQVGCIIFIGGQFCQANAPSDSPAVPSSFNPTTPALSLTIRCSKEHVKSGDEIPIEFDIRNIGTTDYSYLSRTDDRSGRMPEFELTAKDATGQVVADPRKNYVGGLEGGLSNGRTLAPGSSFTQTIPLNRWALITDPGRYEITASYHVGKTSVRSQPIVIHIEPRTRAEMDEYIHRVEHALKNATDDHKDALLLQLMYTCDPAIIPILIEALYGVPDHSNTAFWVTEAMCYYLPVEQSRQALLEAIHTRGVAPGMVGLAEQLHATHEALMKIIALALAPKSPRTWANGALAAQRYGDDRWTVRLVAIATNTSALGRGQAIVALAMNRTDASVTALKHLLDDPDPTVRKITGDAIRTAYLYRGRATGRPLQSEDFDASFQKPE